MPAPTSSPQGLCSTSDLQDKVLKDNSWAVQQLGCVAVGFEPVLYRDCSSLGGGVWRPWVGWCRLLAWGSWKQADPGDAHLA